MVGSVNKVIIVGNVGRDPEIRTTQDGREIANLVIATSESWRDKATGERKEKTEWHRVVVFVDGLVNIIKNYVKKGSKLYVEGSLQTRKWTDNTGVEKYTTEIVLQGFHAILTMLDNRNGGGSHDNDSAVGETGDTGRTAGKFGSDNKFNYDNSDLDDEIPF
jgi:single-strand DNA-binding protein